MVKRISRRDFMAAGASVAGSTALLLPFGARAQATGGPRKNIVVRIDREFASIDPAYRRSPVEGNAMRAIFQHLMVPKPNSVEHELEAASEVKQVTPTTISFKLKPGQMFSDGFGEMTADDVKFSFERIGLPPKAGGKVSTYKADWIGLVGVEVKGKYEGLITLEKPRANIYDVVIADGSGCIVSRKAVEQRGDAFGTKPVGSGPYLVAEYDRQKGVVLRRSPTYSGGRKPYFDEIAIRTITDDKTTELALRAGEVDFALMSPTAADPLRGVAGLTVTDHPSMAYVWLGMNMEKPPLNDLRVRQAIRLGLDVDQMLLAGYNGKAPRLNTAVPPQIMGAWKDAPVYKRNVTEAKALLAAAGAKDLKLRLLVQNQQQFQNMALVAQALLAEIGITITVDAQPGGTYFEAGKGDTGKNLDLYISRFSGKHDPNFVLQWFLPKQIGEWNWSRFNSPEFEKLYNEASSELDPAKRRVEIIDCQKLMDKSSAFVWLTNEASAVISRSWLKPASIPGWIDWQYADFSAT
ncbi:MAG: ABC transporter substrate-binding protein [Burkholderiaceae bacterium]